MANVYARVGQLGAPLRDAVLAHLGNRMPTDDRELDEAVEAVRAKQAAAPEPPRAKQAVAQPRDDPAAGGAAADDDGDISMDDGDEDYVPPDEEVQQLKKQVADQGAKMDQMMQMMQMMQQFMLNQQAGGAGNVPAAAAAAAPKTPERRTGGGGGGLGGGEDEPEPEPVPARELTETELLIRKQREGLAKLRKKAELERLERRRQEMEDTEVVFKVCQGHYTSPSKYHSAGDPCEQTKKLNEHGYCRFHVSQDPDHVASGGEEEVEDLGKCMAVFSSGQKKGKGCGSPAKELHSLGFHVCGRHKGMNTKFQARFMREFRKHGSAAFE